MAAAGADRSLSRKHVAELDGLRGVAVLLVMLHHFVRDCGPLTGAARVLHVFDQGWMGVDLFFALSGFLITGILLDGKAVPGSLRTFYIRRALRIFPLYYFVLLLALLVPWLTHARGTAQAHTVWLWTYLANLPKAFVTLGNPTHVYFNFGHLWSLAIEEQFYLVWPWVATLLSRRALLWVAAGVLPLTLVTKAWLLHLGVPSVAADYFTLVRADGLCAGAVAAILVRRWPEAEVRRVFTRAAIAVGVLCIASLALKRFATYWITLSNHFQLALLFGALVPLTFASAGAQGPVAVLRRPALCWLGSRSYGLYVWHFLLGPVFQDLLSRSGLPRGGAWSFLRVVALFLMSCLAATMSWVLVEKPFLRMKERIAQRSATKDASVPVSGSPA